MWFENANRKLQGLLVAGGTRCWMGTLDYQATDYDQTTDPVLPQFEGPAVYVFWHEYIPFMFYLRGHCDVAMLTSRHRDAEWISQAARFMGFQCIRGSTARGGVTALLRMLEMRRVSFAITPDGPRGPRRRMAGGPVFLASRLGLPLVPVGLGYHRPWRIRQAWDQFAVPRPYSRGRAVFGPRLRLPASLDREGIEFYCRRTEGILNDITTVAEQWAESGCRMRLQRPLRREGIPLHLRQQRAAWCAAHLY